MSISSRYGVVPQEPGVACNNHDLEWSLTCYECRRNCIGREVQAKVDPINHKILRYTNSFIAKGLPAPEQGSDTTLDKYNEEITQILDEANRGLKSWPYAAMEELRAMSEACARSYHTPAAIQPTTPPRDPLRPIPYRNPDNGCFAWVMHAVDGPYATPRSPPPFANDPLSDYGLPSDQVEGPKIIPLEVRRADETRRRHMNRIRVAINVEVARNGVDGLDALESRIVRRLRRGDRNHALNGVEVEDARETFREMRLELGLGTELATDRVGSDVDGDDEAEGQILPRTTYSRHFNPEIRPSRTVNNNGRPGFPNSRAYREAVALDTSSYIVDDRDLSSYVPPNSPVFANGVSDRPFGGSSYAPGPDLAPSHRQQRAEVLLSEQSEESGESEQSQQSGFSMPGAWPSPPASPLVI
jgi:hypothetical protein